MNFIVIERARFNEFPIPFSLMLLLDLVAIKEDNGEYFLMKNRWLPAAPTYVDKHQLHSIIDEIHSIIDERFAPWSL